MFCTNKQILFCMYILTNDITIYKAEQMAQSRIGWLQKKLMMGFAATNHYSLEMTRKQQLYNVSFWYNESERLIEIMGELVTSKHILWNEILMVKK